MITMERHDDVPTSESNYAFLREENNIVEIGCSFQLLANNELCSLIRGRKKHVLQCVYMSLILDNHAVGCFKVTK